MEVLAKTVLAQVAGGVTMLAGEGEDSVGYAYGGGGGGGGVDGGGGYLSFEVGGGGGGFDANGVGAHSCVAMPPPEPNGMFGMTIGETLAVGGGVLALGSALGGGVFASGAIETAGGFSAIGALGTAGAGLGTLAGAGVAGALIVGAGAGYLLHVTGGDVGIAEGVGKVATYLTDGSITNGH